MIFFVCFSLSLDDGRQNIQRAAMDITADDDVSIRKQKTLIKKWDPSSKKYVFKNTDTVKKVKSESGYWIPTSYKSGRYDKWVEKNKIQEESEDSEDETVNPYKKKPTKPSGISMDSLFSILVILLILEENMLILIQNQIYPTQIKKTSS